MPKETERTPLQFQTRLLFRGLVPNSCDVAEPDGGVEPVRARRCHGRGHCGVRLDDDKDVERAHHVREAGHEGTDVEGEQLG